MGTLHNINLESTKCFKKLEVFNTRDVESHKSQRLQSMARIVWKRCSLMIHGMRRMETLHLIRSLPRNSALSFFKTRRSFWKEIVSFELIPFVLQNYLLIYYFNNFAFRS